MRDDPHSIDVPEPAGALAMHVHGHDSLVTTGLFGLAALVDTAAHQGPTVLTYVSIVCGILFGLFNSWIRWRDSEARRDREKLRYFREWEAARDKSTS